MSRRRARAGASVLLAAAGGLTLAGGTAATWVRSETVREVGGVAVTDVATTSGLELAPQGLALGLAAAVAGLVLLALRGPAQVAVGVVLAVGGLVAIGFVVAGVAAAPEGRPAGGGLAAAAGAVAVTVSGLLVLRPAPPPRLPGRYDLDRGAEAGDDWGLASAEEPEADRGEEPRG